MTSFAFVTILPSIAILISTVILRRGTWAWKSLVAACLAVSVGYVYLRIGVAQSCQIDESECVGATATSYLIMLLWGLFAIAFAIRFISLFRTQG